MKKDSVYKSVIMSQVFRFLLVGFVTAVIYFSSLKIFLEIYKSSTNLAVSTSFIIAVLIHFFLNKFYVFKSGIELNFFQFFKFSAVILINLLVTLVIVNLSYKLFDFGPILGSIVALPVTTYVGYVLNKFWVFR